MGKYVMVFYYENHCLLILLVLVYEMSVKFAHDIVIYGDWGAFLLQNSSLYIRRKAYELV